jgi:signal transduction histidine kinase
MPLYPRSEFRANPMTRARAWWRILRDPGLGIGTHLTLFVLLVGLATSGFLLYQTFSAQHSQREAVDLGLENVSVLVVDRMGVPMVGDWYLALTRATRPLAPWVTGATDDPVPLPSVLSPEELIGGRCRCLLAPEGAAVFRLELATDELRFGAEGVGDMVEERLRRRIHAAAAVPASDTTFFWRTQRSVGSLVLVEGDDDFFAVPFVLLYGSDDQPLWAYGLVAPAEAFFSAGLESLLQVAPLLLPIGFRSPGDIQVLASVAISTREAGPELGRFDAPLPPGTSAGPSITIPVLRQGNVLEQLQMTASLHPEFLSSLPMSRPVDDQTSWFAILFLLNVGLVAAALLQVGRENTFLRRRAEFVAGFSHEARNPLATIRLYVQGLRFGRITDEDARERALDIIDRESRRLVHMVANFLTFGAREGGTLSVASQPVEIGDELRSFATEVRSELRERDARLILETNGPAWLRTDPSALQEVLRNLVGNALKYGPPRQSIRLGVQQVQGGVRLFVEDEGPGVSEAEREEIFEPFARTPAAIRSGAGGSGLGLSVVRELVALQGGRVHVEPGHSGRGARFVVHLPSRGVENGASPLDPQEEAKAPV